MLVTTPDWWQSKMLLTINESGSKIARNSVFDCHLSPVRRQMTIENSVSNDFDLRSMIVIIINFFDCRLSGVVTQSLNVFVYFSFWSSYCFLCIPVPVSSCSPGPHHQLYPGKFYHIYYWHMGRYIQSILVNSTMLNLILLLTSN